MRITIKTSGGRVVRTLTLGSKPVSAPLTAKFRCNLRKGTYRFFVSATDSAGNTQMNVASNRLVVRIGSNQTD